MADNYDKIESEKTELTGDKGKKTILNIIIAAAFCIIVYGIWNMVSVQKEYKEARQEYENVRKSAGADILEKADSKELPDIDLKNLQKENPDTVGWLYYPVLGINYPIMQDDDNTYYINHTFSGEKNAAGSLFLDSYGNVNFADDNTYIFGHNMRDGSMFGHLKLIREADAVKENPYFWIYTENGWRTYQIFSYHDADADRKEVAFQIKFENKQAFAQFIRSLEEKSEEKLDVNVKETDKIVSLATCTSDSSVRLVVHGVLVEENKKQS